MVPTKRRFEDRRDDAIRADSLASRCLPETGFAKNPWEAIHSWPSPLFYAIPFAENELGGAHLTSKGLLLLLVHASRVGLFH